MNDGSIRSLEPAIIVIFGITGDLSQRYLLPSLYHLFKDGLLHEKTEILGITRGETDKDDLFKKVELCVNEVDKTCDPDALAKMHAHTSMFHMGLDQSEDFAALLNKLNEIEAEHKICMNRLYYLSIPPLAYQPVILKLGENGLNASCAHGKASTRLLVEKPFGYDLSSAEELIKTTARHFNEEQIFRIDHYMAKETVQNILTFRFKNPIFEALWNHEHIASIEIIAKEKIGIEGRAAFYEPMGALRDFIQSHLIQILGIITMDKPDTMGSQAIHSNKQAALESIRPITKEDVANQAHRSQYQSYRQEVNNPASITETYAAIEVYSSNPRWQEVPMRLVTGKALDERKTEVIITFHGNDKNNNELRFRIQPNEGIELDLVTKKPGYSSEVQETAMSFLYQSGFNNNSHPNAYERVLVDAVRGDHTLFATSEEVLASWKIIESVVEAWQSSGDDLVLYESGGPGPQLSND